MKRLALLVAGVPLVGCVAFPLATPPVRIGIGTGARYATEKATVDAPAAFHVGVYPLQLAPEYLGRQLDFGVGYINETGALHAVQGGYLEGNLAFARDQLGSALFRGSVGAQLRVLYDPDSPLLGRALAFRLALEISKYFAGPISAHNRDGGFFGVAAGEAGAGLFLEGSVAQYARDNIVQVILGVQFRLPATVGIAYAFYTGKSQGK